MGAIGIVATVPIFIFNHYQKGILKINVPVQIFFQSHTMSGKYPVALPLIGVWCQNPNEWSRKIAKRNYKHEFEYNMGKLHPYFAFPAD